MKKEGKKGLGNIKRLMSYKGVYRGGGQVNLCCVSIPLGLLELQPASSLC